MNIGIDSRMYGPHVGGGGLGRYVQQLVTQLSVHSPHHHVLFLKAENFQKAPCSPKMEKHIADIHWYGLKEQLLFPRILDAHKLDLIHFPHWNVPITVKTPFVVTIHDLILLDQPFSARATTRPMLFYLIKYRLFRRVLAHAIEKSVHIIAPSLFTKSRIVHYFPNIAPEKITVIAEGVTQLPTANAIPKENTFLYVGNAYPHKNLHRLIHAFSLLHARIPNARLIIAGPDTVFAKQLPTHAAVQFIAQPTDSELADLYACATVCVFPSLTEGFGLPALEAMSQGVPVVSSNTGSLPEVLGNAAFYVNPYNVEEMADGMMRVLTDLPLQKQLKTLGKQRVRTYSWKRMAQATLHVYETVI